MAPVPGIPEGESFLDYPGAPECCDGLSLIGLDKPEPNFQICFPPTGGADERSGRCTRCGNGICTPPENKCNCPEDCPASSRGVMGDEEHAEGMWWRRWESNKKVAVILTSSQAP